MADESQAVVNIDGAEVPPEVPPEAPPVHEPTSKTAVEQEPPPVKVVSGTAAVEAPPVLTESFTRKSKADLTGLLSKIQALNAEDTQLFFQNLEAFGLEPPLDEGGNKKITYDYLATVSIDYVTTALQQTIDSHTKEEKVSGRTERTSRKSDESGKSGADGDDELDLTEAQKRTFYQKLIEQGYDVPKDNHGKPKITRTFLDRVADNLANEILDAADANFDESDYSSSSESEHRRASFKEDMTMEVPELILGLRLSKGINYVANEKGEKLTYEEIVHYLKKAFSETTIEKQEEQNKVRDAPLRASIREERRNEERTTEFKKVDSIIKMQEMTMRYIPEQNMTPIESDPIDLFETEVRKREVGMVKINEGAKQQDFVHLLQPKEFALRQMDSFATFTSTVERKFSLLTVRGSLLSTHLSDMPSTFSQALLDDLSEAVLTPSTQEFDITENSLNTFMEKWLTDFMSGYSPRNTFTIRIINMISHKQVELRVCKHYTMNEVCHLYMQYEDHPEWYVWKDIYGRVLTPTKTLVENGLVRYEEVLEFQGYRRLPVILLYFRDGFENEPPLPLNPLHALKQREPGLCRNY